MTSPSQAHCLGIIDLWHKVEFFLPFDLKGQVIEDRDAEWAVRLLSEAELATATPGRLWRVARIPEGKELSGFELYIGLFDAAQMTSITREAVRAVCTDEELVEQDERNDVDGATCFAKIRLTAAGQPMLDDISVSTVPWALGRLVQGGLASLDIDAFDSDLLILTEQLQNFQAGRVKKTDGSEALALSGGEVVQLLEVFQQWAGFRPDSGDRAVVAVRARVRKPLPVKPGLPPPAVAPNKDDEEDDEEDDVGGIEVDILNSFFAKDLQRVRTSIADNTAGPALLAYLLPSDPARRVDVYSPDGQRRIVDRLHPRCWPSGHWFSNPAHRMSLMQQFAINALFDKLAGPGLFAVNGPPGTGKTTMLREVFAENLVRRARVLATCNRATDAFIPGAPLTVSFDGVQKVCSVSRLRPELTGFEMVVASSNNAAVENISNDLPKAAALGEPGESPWRGSDGKPAIGYLQPVAHRIAAENGKGTFEDLASDDTPWGLFAAALGSRGNRSRFAWRLTSVPKASDNRYVKGCDPASHQTIWDWRKQYRGIGFAEARRLFAEAEVRVARRRDALAAVADLHAQVAGHDAGTYCRQQQAEADGAAFIHREAEEVHALCEDAAGDADAYLEGLREQQRLLQASRPAWWKRWLGLAQARDHAAMVAENLHEQHGAITAQRLARKNLRDAQQEVQDARAALARAQETLRQRTAQWQRLWQQWLDACAACPQAQAPAEPAGIEQDGWQIDGLWADEEFNRLRCELFAAALQLHEAWLAETCQTGGGFGAGLVALEHLLKGKRLSDPRHALPLWQNLFMVVPVVSSTFASIASQFRELGAGALGWLFIDEAGQAAPQAAAGALWRCQRAVVVGDPRQVEPVFTVPFQLVEAMARQAGLPADAPVLPHKASVQQLADADNRDGAWVSIDGERRQWIGSPLRVHRRCVKQIFDLANVIAYEGRMVYGLRHEEPPPASLDLGSSAWVQVAGEVDYKQVVDTQLDCVFHALVRLTLSHGQLPPLYIVSPFKAVKAALRAQLSDVARWRAHWPEGSRPPAKSVLAEWCRKRVGTVHTFQGKEEIVVWMVLGCSPSHAGGANWAARKPNLLNVALTRARHRVFVIGDAAVWAGKPYFSVAAASLPVLDVAGFMRRMALPRSCETEALAK